MGKSLINDVKSFLDLRKEYEKRFKTLREAPIGDEAKRIAFENMHFMEDKQWINKKLLDGLVAEIKEILTDGWTSHERTHFDDYLEEEVKPYYPMLYALLKMGNL